jgi:transposase-like protein
MDADILQPHFQDADKAREYLEAKRWPDGPICPHCGIVDEATHLELKPERKQRSDEAKPKAYRAHARKGLLRCRGCEKQFSVTVGTIFEDSHVPLNKWLLAYHLVCASKKGMSAHQLHRMLGVTYKTAWFMCHRIRFTMDQEPLAGMLKGVVEIDETYVGGKEKMDDRVKSRTKKTPVVAMVERGGNVQSFPMMHVTADNIAPILKQRVDRFAHLMTDESSIYRWPRRYFVLHDSVTHSRGEYSRREQGKPVISTNSVEGFFSLVKRGLYGTFHHIGRPYLQQYLNEFNFRYNGRKLTDAERANLAIRCIEGKRLTMREPRGKSA